MEKKEQTKKWKKRLLGAVLFGILCVNTLIPMAPFSQFLLQKAQAFTIPSGVTEIGKINNAPVLKAPTNDMDDPWFQELTQNLFEDIGAPSHIIKQVTWGADTVLYNGKDLSSFGSAPTSIFGSDGYLPTDKGINLNVGQSAYIQNVGTAIQTSSGEEIPLSMEVKLEGAEGFGSATSPLTVFDEALLVAKSQNGVLTLGWGVLSEGGTEGGGQGEGGGVEGGGSSDGSSLMFLDNVNYKIMLINSKTGQPLPDDTLMPIKMSDIDASQLATMGGEGALGYILSPDTKLSISVNGMVSSPGGAINNDTTQLSPNSYLVLKRWNKNTVGYRYTDGLNNHADIVTGIFGVIPSWQVGGYLSIDKSTLQYGKDNWNKFYSFDTLSFDVFNKAGKVVDTIKLDKKGNGKSKYLPVGEYTLKEKSTNWASSGQTLRPDTTIKVQAGKTTPVKLENIAVTGQITIKKSGVESGNDLWNERYSLKGNKFELKSVTDGKTYTLTTDETGTAVKKDLPLGEYTITEISSSAGFANTFKPQTVKLTYKDQKTEVVFGEVKGTNQEIKGQNLLQKEDLDTGLDQNGKAVLKTAKFQLFYNDNSTGSSKHKQGDPVKWTDTPKPELLAGEKVTSAVIGGNKVDFGDQVVIDVDDEKLTAAVGNLPLGKFYWYEVDAGEGYVTDSIKHTFEITKQDDKTLVTVTTDTNSKNRTIDAAIKLNKMFTLPENEGSSGFNDIEFVANPLEGTVAEPVTMITGVDPVTGDDGYALGNLVYGDWVLEEKSEPEGRKKIRPIYIHMETDQEKDILTISASYNNDFSKPYSTRKFALQDSSTEKNPNSKGTVGSVTTEKPTISLSTLHFNNNPDTPDVPNPPTPPTKDVTKTDGGESINEGNVALNSDFFYELNSSVLQPNRQDTTSWTINDDYDENFDRYNGTFKLYATKDFDSYKAGDELPQDFVKAEDKKGKVLFTAQKAFLDVVNKHKDKEVGFTVHASFYRFKDSDKVVNTFVETINDVKQDSNEVYTKTPKPEPHKFDLSEEKVDLTGDKLLDDDKEMKDRYEESNKDPYNDKTDNNEKENINTTEVKPGQMLVYQLWLDTTPFDETSELTYLRMVDKYDAASVTVNKDKLKIYDAKGNDATKNFKFEDDGKGTLTISANVFKKAKNSKGEEVSIVDTEKIPLGQIYKIDAPMTVKKEVKAGTDIINTANQEWADSDGTEDSHITEKRVNKVPEAKEPKKEEPKNPVEKVAEKVLPHTGDSPTSIFVKVLGWIIVLGTTVYFTVRSKRNQQIVNDEEPF